MKYDYIELNRFDRFNLNRIEHFSMTMTDAVQLIIGTNGSGKSSLLQEMTPLPAYHGDYAKEGSKIIHISHNRSKYVLKSVFSPTQKHTFTKDGEVLHDGNITIQKELVKQHFGITPEIDRLLRGEEQFTSMSPLRRKEWFITLCETNYDYAIKVYNKLKEKHRDAVGAIKLAKKRLVSESEKLIASDEEKKLNDEAQSIHEALNILLEIRKPTEYDSEELQFSQDKVFEELIKQSKALNSVLVLKTEDLSDEAIEENIQLAQDNKTRANTLVEKYSKDYEILQKKIDALRKAEQQTIDTLQVSITELSTALQSLQSKTLVVALEFRAKVALEAFTTIKHTLADIFSSIPPNKDKKYSQEALAQKRQRLSELVILKATLGEDLSKITAKLKHMAEHKDHPDLQCPSCHHKFSLQYEESKYVKLDIYAQSLATRLETEIFPEIKEIETYLVDCSDYARLYRQYVACSSSMSVLNVYWQYLFGKKTITDNPSSGLMELTLIEQDILRQIQIQDITESIKEKDLLLISLKDIGGLDLNTLVKLNEDLEVLISEQTQMAQQAAESYNLAVAHKSRSKLIKALLVKIQGYIHQAKDINKQKIETLRRLELNAAIREIQSLLASKEYTLNNASRQKSIVESISDQIYTLELEEQALSILVKQLSPTEGLIAEGLLGFIKGFISQVNSAIKKIWTYSLIIKSCEVLEDTTVDLDYKFPMMVGDSLKAVPDISKGSTGMREVIDLAFKITAMKYLHLQDSPLVIDEFGKAFDEAHRHAATTVIKALIEQSTFTQLFIISHYSEAYGALSNAEVCVLNELNITLPASHKQINAHVTMK